MIFSKKKICTENELFKFHVFQVLLMLNNLKIYTKKFET